MGNLKAAIPQMSWIHRQQSTGDGHMNALQPSVSHSIRVLRERMGIGQEAFADHIGMHRACDGAVKRGKKNLTLQTIERIANGLGVEAAALFAATSCAPGGRPGSGDAEGAA